MDNELNIEGTTPSEEGKPKKKKRLFIPWKFLALYISPAILVFFVFFLMHNYIVKPPLTRDEIMQLITNESKGKSLEKNSEETLVAPEKVIEELPKGSDIPFIGPQHYYHSFTGALATDLKNGSGILTIEVAVSIFMGKLNAEAYFNNFKSFEPALRSAILALMRTKTKSQLEKNNGKEVLKLEVLELINKELINLGAKPEIKTVQFTKILLI